MKNVFVPDAVNLAFHLGKHFRIMPVHSGEFEPPVSPATSREHISNSEFAVPRCFWRGL